MTTGLLMTFSPQRVRQSCSVSLSKRRYVARPEPTPTFDVNVTDMVRLLEAVGRSATFGAVVAVTSDKWYAEMLQALGRPYVEGHALGGVEPYGAGKACMEIVVAVYREAWTESLSARRFRSSGRRPGTPRQLHLVLDSSHAAYELGWRCRLSHETAIDSNSDRMDRPLMQIARVRSDKGQRALVARHTGFKGS